MVTDLGGIDDGSFNQGTWEGITRYCTENNVSHTYLRPIEQTTDGYLTSIGQAVSMGAKIILCPGYLFETAIFQAQDLYPDIKFVLIDAFPNNGVYDETREERTADNVYAVQFAEQDTGFLAGYACVKEGFRKLAFFGGMAVPAVMRFGYGFVEGAEYAAKELGLTAGEVEITYWYSGDFDPSPAKLTTVTGWYESGTEVIFSCGGTIVENAIAAAESMEGKYVVGVDVDQNWLSEVVITSAMKNLGDVCYTQLSLFFNDQFVGGTNATLGAAAGMVSLPQDFSRFQNFTQADYDALYEKLANDVDGLQSGLTTDADAATPDLIELEIVKLTYIA
jgi:basic membrane protein A